ncbi:MAG: ABC transporter ATP-binding protein [Desulfovibrionaceae bacterium]|nr:ABC transporter ATP-binding protein [Desulfovibrionaceae bacterium]
MLELHEISKNFGRLPVLKEISLSLKAQSLTCLGGANGSGKSTLLKIMAGLIPPSQGHISYASDFKTLAYVGHDTFLYPNLTALENLNFWQRCYHLNLTLADLEDLLEEFGLLAFADQYPSVFSRGMAQKLNLARVMLLNPSLCLLDEPQTGLDVASQDFLQQKLLRLKEQGSCIILISHDLDQTLNWVDQGYYLEQGSLKNIKR